MIIINKLSFARRGLHHVAREHGPGFKNVKAAESVPRFRTDQGRPQ